MPNEKDHMFVLINSGSSTCFLLFSKPSRVNDQRGSQRIAFNDLGSTSWDENSGVVVWPCKRHLLSCFG